MNIEVWLNSFLNQVFDVKYQVTMFSGLILSAASDYYIKVDNFSIYSIHIMVFLKPK